MSDEIKGPERVFVRVRRSGVWPDGVVEQCDSRGWTKHATSIPPLEDGHAWREYVRADLAADAREWKPTPGVDHDADLIDEDPPQGDEWRMTPRQIDAVDWDLVRACLLQIENDAATGSPVSRDMAAKIRKARRSIEGMTGSEIPF